MKRMRNSNYGEVVLKQDNTFAVRLDDDDCKKFLGLYSALSNTDQVLRDNIGKMPNRDLVAILNERKNACIDLETFVGEIYKKYRLDDSIMYGFDPLRGEMFQLPQPNNKRMLIRFR